MHLLIRLASEISVSHCHDNCIAVSSGGRCRLCGDAAENLKHLTDTSSNT